ncbi:MAG: DUF2244 domain-containing protein [bacterium]
MVTFTETNGALQIVLTPNRSASWRQTRACLLVIGIFSLFIATIWAMLGIWMILPFAGLEVGLLSFLVYRVSLKTHQKEVLTIDAQHILLERGRLGQNHPRWQQRFDAKDTEIVITRPRHSLSPLSICLASCDSKVPVGDFLNAKDADHLTDLIRRSGVRYRFCGQTAIVALECFGD